MNPAVWFAIGVLAVVFLLSFMLLVFLLWRRRQQKQQEQEEARLRAEDGFKLAKTTRSEKVDKLVELVPLLDDKMEQCPWRHDTSEGPFANVIGVLRLTTEVIKTLSDVNLSLATTKIYEVIAQAMCRVDTHFHELIDFIPESDDDVRVIEARALTLTTTVWALSAAFSLHGFDKADEIDQKIEKMYQHIDALRMYIPGYKEKLEEREKKALKEQQEREGSQSTGETNADGTPAEGGVLADLADLAPPSGPPPPVPSIQIDAPVDVHSEPEVEKTETAVPSEEAAPVPDATPAAAESNGSVPTPAANGSQSTPEEEESVETKDSVEENDPLIKHMDS